MFLRKHHCCICVKNSCCILCYCFWRNEGDVLCNKRFKCHIKAPVWFMILLVYNHLKLGIFVLSLLQNEPFITVHRFFWHVALSCFYSSSDNKQIIMTTFLIHIDYKIYMNCGSSRTTEQFDVSPSGICTIRPPSPRWRRGHTEKICKELECIQL